jgi:hypothetical protein
LAEQKELIAVVNGNQRSVVVSRAGKPQIRWTVLKALMPTSRHTAEALRVKWSEMNQREGPLLVVEDLVVVDPPVATYYCLACQDTKPIDPDSAAQCVDCRQWACNTCLSDWGRSVGNVRACQLNQTSRQSPCFSCRRVERRPL